MPLPPFCFIMYHFQILWKRSVKLYDIPFLKTYCTQVLELHVFSWMLECFITSPSLPFSSFSSPVAQAVLFDELLLGLITLTFVFSWMFSFDVDCEASRFPNETYIKGFVHSFTDVLWREIRGRRLEN